MWIFRHTRKKLGKCFFCKYWARRQVGKTKRHWGGWVNPPKNSFLAHTVLVGCVIQKRTVHNDHTLSMSSLQMYTIYRKVLSSSNILVDLTTTPIFLKTSIQRILIWRKIYLVDKCDGIYFESATTEILGCLIEGFLSGCLLNLFWHSHYKDVPKLPCIQMLSGILLPN